MIRTKVHTILLGFILLTNGLLIAQPVITVDTDTIFVALDTLDSGEISTHWDVSNNQFGTLQLMCSRNFIDIVDPYNYPFVLGADGSYEKFCWGPICYNYGEDASSTNEGLLVSIPQNVTDTSFIPYFYPNGVLGTTTIQYCFHPVGNEDFSACASITYVVIESADISELNEFEASISSVYPNPVVFNGSIDYSIPEGKIGVIEIIDITGKVVTSFKSLRNDGRVVLSVDNMSEGLYFSTLELNGIVITTKRFVIAK